MDIAQLKEKIIAEIHSTNDNAFLESFLEYILIETGQIDCIDLVDKKQLKQLNKAIKQADNGQTIPHEQVMQMAKKWIHKTNS